MKMAREGWPFLLSSLAFGLAFLALGWWPLALVFFLLMPAFAFFFRDPKRTIPPQEHLVLSPADGKIVRIDNLASHPNFAGPVNRISIFLSLFDVHLTRAPLSGTVKDVQYHPGKFLPAYKDGASAGNESNSLVIQSPSADIFLKQIVGVAARRIKCFVKSGAVIRRGQKIGLMYFGSRVEIYLAQEIPLKAGLNDKVRAGETVIAEVQQ